MAKKQKINYGPNLGLIGGARTLAESESMMTSAGGMAFGAAFSEAIMSGIEEREKSKAQIDAYASEIKLPSNIVKVDASNRPQIMEFIRRTRSNVVELAKKYQRTKDQNILDEIQMEKAKVFNLNDQLGGFVADQQQYITASDKQLLARGKSFDYKKYDNIYSKNSAFSIDNDGSIGFTTNGVYEKWSDIGGRWNVNNNIWGTSLLKLDQAVVTNASKGGKFDKTGIYNNSLMLFNNMGAEEVQVALEQDVTGDAYENLSFENIWANGKMDPSYYKGYEAFKNPDGTYQTDWMFDDNNVRQASNLMARYTADVLQNRHDDNFVNPRGSSSSLTNQYPILGVQSYTTGPGGSRTWTDPAVKQQAYNFFIKPRPDGTTYDGTHAFYVQVPVGWHAYSSVDDYKKDRDSGYKEKDLRKGTYSLQEVFGFETGISIQSQSGGKLLD